jgi:hypothetical protein
METFGERTVFSPIQEVASKVKCTNVKSRWFYQRVLTGFAREVKLALPERSIGF